MFNFRDAIKFPIFVSSKTKLLNLSGDIEISSKIHFGMIRIGYGDVGIFDIRYSRTILEIKGKLIFAGNAFIGHGSKISVNKNGVLSIGKNFRVSAESSFITSKSITIGDDCLFSWDIQIMDTDFHKIYDVDSKLLNFDKNIVLGHNVWIGCRCLILKGSVIPDYAIIAANSTVSKVLTGEKVIFGGYPLKILKRNVTWEF